MVIHKREGLEVESKRYLNEGSRSLTNADKVVYRIRAERLGIDVLRRRLWFKIGVGGVVVGVGVVTLPFPTGSFFLIGAGCSLMIDGGLDLWGCYRRAKRRARREMVFIVCDIRRRCCELKEEVRGRVYHNSHPLNLRRLKEGVLFSGL